MIRWDAARATSSRSRRGSAASARAPYESLNLTRGTGDDAERVEENRRIALRGARPRCRPARRSTGRCIRRPCTARGRGRAASRATGSGATSRGCRCSRSPPTACRSRSRAPTASRARSPSLHAGWRGLADGVVAAGVAALGDGRDGGGRRAGDRAVLLRGRRRGVGALRRRPDRRAATSISGRRPSVRSARAGVGAVERARPLHALPPGALLLAPPRRARARRAGGDRCCRLTQIRERARAACSSRSGPA